MEKENYNGYNNENGEPKLYDELPKEVVDMLMETHPLMGKNEQLDGATMYRRRNKQNTAQAEPSQDTTSYVDWSGGGGEETIVGRRTRRYAQEDGDQQYTMRFQTIQSEGGIQDDMYQTQKIDFTPQYSPHQQEYNTMDYDNNQYDNSYEQQPEYMEEVSQNTNYDYQNSYQGGYQQDDYENSEQNGYMEQNTYNMSERRDRKGPLMQEIEITLPGPGGVREEPQQGRRNRHNHYEDFDLARGAKQMDLDELYSDDYDDEETISFRPGKKLSIVFSIIVIVLIGFLGFKCVSLGGKLREAEKTIAENNDLNEKYQSLEMENLKLEEELRTLKAGGTPETPEGENNEVQGTETNGDDPGNFDWYTVTESDNSWWALAQKFYNDGTQYQKILDANGKKESDYVRVGDKLKIPK